ncbi:MAG: protein-glutamate O-methyltransferase CheR [Alphaproteobacteria bacterium]|nr:MAG: protein-glutamate O-methyltransferase CheR [Alphaproteobacteria bacterium]
MINKVFYKALAVMIEKETGIVYSESDYDRLTFRVVKLKELLKVSTDDELLKVLQNSPSSNVQSLLVSTSTNNETSFFRAKKPFDILANHIIPEILKSKTSKHIKIWSVASSTGQEPYSLAMKVKDTASFSDCLVEIKASDIDHEVLLKCKAGIYNQAEIQRGLPIQFLTKYFDQIDLTTWSINNQIKSMINFFHFNLLSGSYPANEYDIIFCRNVLIYQSLENKTKVINNLFNSLKPKGFLVLGGAENLIGIKSNFKTVIFDDFVVYLKE